MARASSSSSSSSSSPASSSSPSAAAVRRPRVRRDPSSSSSSRSSSTTITRAPPPSAASASADVVSCEGYLRLRRRAALTWSTRFAVLRGAELYVFYSKQDAALRRNLVDSFALASGRLAPRPAAAQALGLELLARDQREFHARVFSRGDLARWVTAFHRLAVKSEALAAAQAGATTTATRKSETKTGETAGARRKTLRGSDDATAGATDSSSDGVSSSDDDGDSQDDDEPNPVVHDGDEERRRTSKCRRGRRRRVSFNGSVMVRVIPSLAPEQVAELFYSKAEVERFSVQASSLLSRTEEAMSCARLALQRHRPTLLSWRRQSQPPSPPQEVV